MADIKRYMIDWVYDYILPADFGEWVKHSDHEAALKTADELAHRRGFEEGYKHSDHLAAIQAAVAENEGYPGIAYDLETLKSAARKVLRYVEHDGNCDLAFLDEDGKHKACSCGLSALIEVIARGAAHD